MATLTISSGVYVGTRGSGNLTSSWFAGSTTSQFTTFSLTSSNSDVSLREGPQGIVGHADLYDDPVVFEFSRRTRDTITDSLAGVAVKGLLNGGPRTTLSGFRDAVAQAGYLAKFAWSERRNDGGAAEAFEVWGVCGVQAPTVRGLNESMQLLVFPCDVLWWAGTNSVFIRPGANGAPA